MNHDIQQTAAQTASAWHINIFVFRSSRIFLFVCLCDNGYSSSGHGEYAMRIEMSV